MSRNNPELAMPSRRRLRVFAFDPMSTRLTGRFLTVDVPFEAGLKPGPVGELVHVVDYDGVRRTWYRPVDLDDPAILMQDGLRPSEGDPRTHQQVVYAVSVSVLERFERFAGRRFRWRADRALRLVPHAFEGRNAYFDPQRQAVLFGYYTAEKEDPGENLPGQVMFTCLSADIVAHEVTHAIVHRWRPLYAQATNPDVFAWHEAFADLVALFQHFAHREVVEAAVASTRADLSKGRALFALAAEFGRSTGRGAALREAVSGEEKVDPARFATLTEPHERGAVFVGGVFDAYLQTYQSAIADLLRIATGGTGVLPEGHLHPDLVRRVAAEAVKAADRLLGMVVRAFDYLPVVDVTFGDVIRSIVTADRALYPDDDAHLRSRLVEALRRRGVYPSHVSSLTDEALTWPGPPRALSLDRVHLAPLILSSAQDLDPTGEAGDLRSDPALEREREPAREAPAGTAYPRRLWAELSRWAGRHAHELGLQPGRGVTMRGVHVAYRQAADRQPRPEIVLQFSQRRPELEDASWPEDIRPVVRAGTTVIARVDGRVDHVIAKPLPLREAALRDLRRLDDDVRRFAEANHEAGRLRLVALRTHLEGLEASDPVSGWTNEPAQARLTFASLHAGQEW